jgi:hypothetical protein
MKTSDVLIALAGLGAITHVLMRRSDTVRVLESMSAGYSAALKPLRNEVDVPVEDDSLIRCYQCPTTMPRTLYADHERAHDIAIAAVAKQQYDREYQELLRARSENVEAARRATAEARWTIEGTGHEDDVWEEPPAPKPDHYTIKETRERIRRRLI